MHLLKKKKLLIVLSLVLPAFGSVGSDNGSGVESSSPTHELYDSTDESSLSPTLQMGGRAEVNWQGYPDAALYI